MPDSSFPSGRREGLGGAALEEATELVVLGLSLLMGESWASEVLGDELRLLVTRGLMILPPLCRRDARDALSLPWVDVLRWLY